MKTFGLIVPKGAGRVFEANVRELAEFLPVLGEIILATWKSVRTRVASLTRQLLRSARQSKQCRLLMSITGIGAVTATSYLAAIKGPANFTHSQTVGA